MRDLNRGLLVLMASALPITPRTYFRFPCNFVFIIETEKELSSYISLQKHLERLSIDKEAQTFKPGLDYKITVRLIDTIEISALTRIIFSGQIG